MPLLQPVVSKLGKRVSSSFSLPNKNHFLLQLSSTIKLGADLIVEVQELLERLVLGRHNKSNDVHQQ